VKKNILLILTDQWPHDFFGRFGLAVPTPASDGLASEGTVFTNAFTTCPLCSPARGTLLTSRMPWQNGVRDNIGGGYSLQTPLNSDELTWIEGAVGRGYHVGYYGKWHLGPDGPIARGAHRHTEGFESGARVYDPATSSYSYAAMADTYATHREFLAGGVPPFYGRTTRPEEGDDAFRCAADAHAFLREYAGMDTGRPFFLTVSFRGPHFPHYMPDRFADLAESIVPHIELPRNLHDEFSRKPAHHGQPWWPSMDTSPFDESEWRRVIAYSIAHVALVDEAVGRVLKDVGELGLAHSTTVVFTADHGDMCGAHNRFDKGAYFYDEVWRIPLTVRAPGIAPASQNAFVSLVDLARTLFGMVGIEAKEGRPLMGRDIRPLLGPGASPDGWPERAYGVYDLYNGMRFAVRAIRDTRYKYVWNPQAVDELYDLECDPAELRNRVDDPALAVERDRLRAELMAWLREAGDDLPGTFERLPGAGTIVATGAPGP